MLNKICHLLEFNTILSTWAELYFIPFVLAYENKVGVDELFSILNSFRLETQMSPITKRRTISTQQIHNIRVLASSTTKKSSRQIIDTIGTIVVLYMSYALLHFVNVNLLDCV